MSLEVTIMENKKRISSIQVHRKAWPDKEKMGQLDHITVWLDGEELFFYSEEENGKGFKIISDDGTGVTYWGKWLSKENAQKVWESGYKFFGADLWKHLLPIVKENIDEEYVKHYGKT